MTSQGSRNRRRGADAERQVVNYLRTVGWPDARRTLAGDGRQPGDVSFEPGIHLEVKDRAQSAWPSWRAQAVAECAQRVPVVLRRERGNPRVGEWRCDVRVHDWAALGGRIAPEHVVTCLRSGCPWQSMRFADFLAALGPFAPRPLLDTLQQEER